MVAVLEHIGNEIESEIVDEFRDGHARVLFERACHVLWLPDVFGYSAALPQILRKSGVDWFVTSKISWNDVNRMPHDTFIWRGIPGSPNVKIEFAGDFLKRLKKKMENNPEVAKWCGELYLEYHRATYTTMAYNKKQNRQCEFLYQNAEWLGVLGERLLGVSFPPRSCTRVGRIFSPISSTILFPARRSRRSMTGA